MRHTNPMRWRDVRIQTPPTHLIAERPDAPFPPWHDPEIDPVRRAEQRYQELQLSSVLAIAQMAQKRDFWQLVAMAVWLVAATLGIVRWL